MNRRIADPSTLVEILFPAHELQHGFSGNFRLGTGERTSEINGVALTKLAEAARCSFTSRRFSFHAIPVPMQVSEDCLQECNSNYTIKKTSSR